MPHQRLQASRCIDASNRRAEDEAQSLRERQQARTDKADRRHGCCAGRLDQERDERPPQNEPRSGVAAALPSTVRSAEPANAFRPSVMTVMPRRKRPTPPNTEIAVDMRSPRGERPRGHLLAEGGARSYFSRLRAARAARNSFFFFASTVG
jgi:hypothetical protein